VIHSFSVNNFRSIREEVKQDFRIPGTTPSLPCFRASASRPHVRLPAVMVLIGANGSGKTTLLRAMVEVVDFVANSYLQPAFGIDFTFPPFLDPEMRSRPTRIEAEFDGRWFSANDDTASLCRYVLEIDRSNSTGSIGYEALFVHPKGRPRRVLERYPDKPIHVARELRLRQTDERLSSVPPNASAIFRARADGGLGSWPWASLGARSPRSRGWGGEAVPRARAVFPRRAKEHCRFPARSVAAGSGIRGAILPGQSGTPLRGVR